MNCTTIVEYLALVDFARSDAATSISQAVDRSVTFELRVRSAAPAAATRSTIATLRFRSAADSLDPKRTT